MTTRRQFAKTAAAAAAGALAAPKFISSANAAVSPGTIRYWDFVDPTAKNPRGVALAKSLEVFKRKFPQVDVKVEVIPYTQLDSLTIQSGAAGQTPDVVRIQFPLFWQSAAADAILPLDEFADRLGPNFKSDSLSEWEATMYNGKKYAIPYHLNGSLMYYRDDVFRELGIKVPTNFTELADAGRALLAANRGGFAVGLSRNNQCGVAYEWVFPLIRSFGGQVLGEDGKSAFNSPAGARAIDFIAELIKTKATPASATSVDYEGIAQGVTAGTICLNNLASTRASGSRAAGKLTGKLMTAPMVGPTSAEPLPTTFIGWTLAIGKNTKNREAAWAFIEHCVSPEQYIENAKIAGEMPQLKSVFNDNFFASAEGSEMRMWKDYFAKYGRYEKYRASPVDLWEGMGDAIAQVVLKGRPTAEALNELARKYDSLL